MHDLIYRRDAIDILDAYQVMLENGEENPYSWARFRMSELPSAQPERTGRWIQNDNGTWSCNRCSSWIPDEQHYYANWCLFCGARMEGGNESD